MLVTFWKYPIISFYVAFVSLWAVNMLRNILSSAFLAFILILTLFQVCCGYFITIDAHDEECFYDKVASGTKMSLTFEVVEGGFLDVDVTVCIKKISENITC